MFIVIKMMKGSNVKEEKGELKSSDIDVAPIEPTHQFIEIIYGMGFKNSSDQSCNQHSIR